MEVAKVCPFVDQCDSRCAKHLTLENIFSAFAHCANRYEDCPAYREICAERRCCAAEAPDYVLAAS
jgi:hypothetical protein